MKAVAVLMILIGLALGLGGLLEFVLNFNPERARFWIGVFVTAVAAFFVVAGVLLLWRGVRVRGTVMLAAVLMSSATIAATALGVMGPPATLTGLTACLVVIAWFWRTRQANA